MAHSFIHTCIDGEREHTGGPKGWSDWLLRAMPEPRTELEGLDSWRPSSMSFTFQNLKNKSLDCDSPRHAPLLSLQLGFAKDAQSTDIGDAFRTLMRKANKLDHPIYIANKFSTISKHKRLSSRRQT